MHKNSNTTTRQLDQLTRLFNDITRLRITLAGDDTTVANLRLWRQSQVKALHAFCKPAARPHAAAHLAQIAIEAFQRERTLLNRLEEQNCSVWMVMPIPPDDTRLEAQISALQEEISHLQAENQVLRRRLERAPEQITVQTTKGTIKVTSEIDQQFLRLMATTGLNRSWRLFEQLGAMGISQNLNAQRNAVRDRLIERELIDHYRVNDKPQVWTPTPGGGRQLFWLNPSGRDWAERAFGIPSAPPELPAMLKRHPSLPHAVGILEARDHLRAAGYAVADQPEPFLADATQLRGRRAEPDLLLTLDGQPWPVEVQREVHQRQTEKWAKSLELAGRLVLVLFNEIAREKQQRLLAEALAARHLPAGEIRLVSLEALESEQWKWIALHSLAHSQGRKPGR